MMNTDYKFEVITFSYYKKYRAFYPNYIRNKKTGEDMGDHLALRIYLFDADGKRLKEPVYEEDCYEYARYPNS